jgi:predicted nucleotidyltransferase
MEFESQFVEVFQKKEQYCRSIAAQLAKLDSAVLAVALIGGCARGVVFPEDIDFLILVRDPKKIPKLEKRIKNTGLNNDNTYSFIFYTEDNLRKLVTGQETSLHAVHTARFLTRLLRHAPALKRILIKLLGHRKTYFQMREVLPQSFQTAIPLYDQENILAEFLQTQAEVLDKVLSPWEKTFYSPYGFQKLLDAYLRGNADLLTVQSILRKCDIESPKYVERLARFYETKLDFGKAQRCREIFPKGTSR